MAKKFRVGGPSVRSKLENPFHPIPYMGQIIDREEEYEKIKQGLIQDMSQIHLAHSTDPATLCSARLQEIDLQHPNATIKFPELQNRLFCLCDNRGEAWTKL